MKTTYSNENEREDIIREVEKQGLFLLEDVITKDESFIISGDKFKKKQPTKTELLEQRLQATEDMLLQLMTEGMV